MGLARYSSSVVVEYVAQFEFESGVLVWFKCGV